MEEVAGLRALATAVAATCLVIAVLAYLVGYETGRAVRLRLHYAYEAAGAAGSPAAAGPAVAGPTGGGPP